MDIDGHPYWDMTFDKDGDSDKRARSELLDAVTTAGLTDLVIFSHGWNNDQDAARHLYATWFAMLPPLLPAGTNAKVGMMGIIWPSMRWADEPIPNFPAADAAGLHQPAAVSDPIRALGAVYAPGQQNVLDELADLLASPPSAESEIDPGLARFQQLMNKLAASEQRVAAPDDNGEANMLEEPPRQLAQRFASTIETGAGPAADPDDGGAASFPRGLGADPDTDLAAAGLGDLGRRLWAGAKEALRQLTYWQMKGRAGTVGSKGLGPLLVDLHTRSPQLRVHLIGHSFGARLVSFGLTGIPDVASSPVQSLTMMQGAFSHNSFAATLPWENNGGALNGQETKVGGPIVCCFSHYDGAVGLLYPLASMASGTDASALADEVQARWGGMGHDGTQRVTAAAINIESGTNTYAIPAAGFVNVDAQRVVCSGGPPSGAHSDIYHTELVGVLLSAAQLTG